MFVIIGFAVVIVAIVVGFTVAGGNLVLLLQVAEFIVIGGTALGSILIASPLPLIKKIISYIPQTLKSHHISKQDYLDLLKSFNDLFLLAQRDGLLAIEKHIEDPLQSDILSKSEKFVKDSFARDFFSDTMKVMLSGGIPPHELEGLIEAEIETFDLESRPVTSSIATVGDSLPGIGIVAAVLGIIVTMSSIDQGAEVVGHHVAAALVGTFLGVLMAYGFVNPISKNIEHILEDKKDIWKQLKLVLWLMQKGILLFYQLKWQEELFTRMKGLLLQN